MIGGKYEKRRALARAAPRPMAQSGTADLHAGSVPITQPGCPRMARCIARSPRSIPASLLLHNVTGRIAGRTWFPFHWTFCLHLVPGGVGVGIFGLRWHCNQQHSYGSEEIRLHDRIPSSMEGDFRVNVLFPTMFRSRLVWGVTFRNSQKFRFLWEAADGASCRLG